MADTLKMYLIFHRFYQRNLCLIEVILVNMAIKNIRMAILMLLSFFTTSSKLALILLAFIM